MTATATLASTFAVTTPSDLEIAMTRVFDASPALVFEAFTTPELVQRWLLGPEGWTMPVCEIDLRVGGAWRYVWKRTSNGEEMMMHGVYREVSPPSRTVHTERFGDGEALVTTTYEAEGGRTRLTQTMAFPTTEARDFTLKTGMETGVAISYDRLERMLAEG